MGFKPRPLVTETTMGIQTAAVAVLEVTSERTSVTVMSSRQSPKPPDRALRPTASPIMASAPLPVMRQPSASPPAKTYMSPQTIFFWVLSQLIMRPPPAFFGKKVRMPQSRKT